VKARPRTALGTGFLLVILAAVGGIAYFGVHRRGEERARSDEAEKKVFLLEPAAVRELRVSAKGDEVRLVRGPGESGWLIASPVDAAANEEAVARLLGRLATLERRGVSASAGAPERVLASFGLDAPKVRLELVLDDGRTERLALGDTTGFDGAMFVMPTDGRVLVVSGNARPALELGLADLMKKKDPPSRPAEGPPASAGKTGG
jgi:Domain of unknown function (DUF4340)